MLCLYNIHTYISSKITFAFWNKPLQNLEYKTEDTKITFSNTCLYEYNLFGMQALSFYNLLLTTTLYIYTIPQTLKQRDNMLIL